MKGTRVYKTKLDTTKTILSWSITTMRMTMRMLVSTRQPSGRLLYKPLGGSCRYGCWRHWRFWNTGTLLVHVVSVSMSTTAGWTGSIPHRSWDVDLPSFPTDQQLVLQTTVVSTGQDSPRCFGEEEEDGHNRDNGIVGWHQSVHAAELNRFYAANFGTGRRKTVPTEPKDGDVLYTLQYKEPTSDCNSVSTKPTVVEDRHNNQSNIVAVLRLSPYTGNSDGTGRWHFLRALCVAEHHRKRGIGTDFVRVVWETQRSTDHVDGTFMEKEKEVSSFCDVPTATDHDDDHDDDQYDDGWYCFADPSLTKFYEQSGFLAVEDSLGTDRNDNVPRWMSDRFRSMQSRLQRKGKDLALFVRKPATAASQVSADSITQSVSSSSIRQQSDKLPILLVQHGKEVLRPTSTARFATESSHVTATTVVWSGKADNKAVLKAIELIQNRGDDAVLVWTGGDSSSYYPASTTTKQSAKAIPTFVVLDGTWQEAKSMFRKIPLLHSLPRLSLKASEGSRYTLRKDYSGWHERFSRNNETLLCTAEAIAELVEQFMNVREGADEIRTALDIYQQQFHQGGGGSCCCRSSDGGCGDDDMNGDQDDDADTIDRDDTNLVKLGHEGIAKV